MVLPIPSVEEISPLNRALLTALDTANQSRVLNYADNLAGAIDGLDDASVLEGAQAQFNNLLQFTKVAEEQGVNVADGWTGPEFQLIADYVQDDLGLQSQLLSNYDTFKNQTLALLENQALADNLNINFGAADDGGRSYDELANALNLAQETALNTPAVTEAASGSPSDEVVQEELGAKDAKGTTNMGLEPSTGQTPAEQAGAAPVETTPGGATADDGGLPDILQLLLQSLFSAIDKDGDGKISPAELTAFLKSADENSDGKLGARELLEAISGKDGAQAAANDLGGSENGISIADLTQMLTAADVNGDGLDMQELTGALVNLMVSSKSSSGGENPGAETRPPEEGGTQPSGEEASASPPEEQKTEGDTTQETGSAGSTEAAGDPTPESSAGAMSGLLTILLRALFNSMDKNGDGKITPEEITAFLEAADTNGDGKLGSGELLNALVGGESGGDLASGQGMDLDQFSNLLLSADANGDGLQEQELIDAMMDVLTPNPEEQV